MRSFVLSALVVLTATPALAATRGHMNRCSDATRELRGATSMVYAERDVEPKEAQGAIAHINQHTDRYNRAMRMLDSAGAWDASDPDLAECVQLLARSKAYIDATQQKIKVAEALGLKQGPVFQAATGPERRQVFFLLATVMVEPKARAFDNLKPAQAKALVDLLAPVEAACQSAMPEATQTPPKLPTGRSPTEFRTAGVALPGQLTDRADWWCWVSSHRTELALRALGNVFVLSERYGNHHMVFADIQKAGDGWSGSAEPWLFDIVRDDKPFMAGLRTAIGAWYQAFAMPVPDQPFPGLADQITAVRAAVTGAAGRNRIEPSKDHDKALEGKAKTAVGKLYPKVAAVAAWMDAATWTIELNGLGLPIQRYRSGQVVYRVGSDPWCLQRTFNVVEAHMGGGKYQTAPSAGLLGAAKVVQCP